MCYTNRVMKRKSILGLTLVTLLLAGCQREHPPIDWNDAALDWHSYEEGIEALKATGGKGILIIYADWCPTCKQYSGLFRYTSVIDALEGLTLIRLNMEQQPALSRKYNVDGEYVPRTFALDEDGRIIRDLNAGNPKWRHYLPANNRHAIIDFADALHDY